MESSGNKTGKVWIVFLAVLVVTFAAAGCASQGDEIQIGRESQIITNTVQGVSLTILESSADSVAYQISNATLRDFQTWGYDTFSIEVEQNGVWYEINAKRTGLPAVKYIVLSGTSHGMRTTWKKTYGTLPNGHYRLLKELTFVNEDDERFVMSAEFDVPAVSGGAESAETPTSAPEHTLAHSLSPKDVPFPRVEVNLYSGETYYIELPDEQFRQPDFRCSRRIAVRRDYQ